MSTSRKIVKPKIGMLNEALTAVKRHFFAPKKHIILA